LESGFFLAFIVISHISLCLYAEVYAEGIPLGGGFDQGQGSSNVVNISEIGPSLFGTYNVDLGTIQKFFADNGYDVTEEQIQAAAAAYVEANVDPQFEGSLEDFIVFLGDYVGAADLPRYEPTVPEYPGDASTSLPPVESISANPAVPEAGDQPTAVEGDALPAEAPLTTEPTVESAAENPSNGDASVPVAGDQAIVGEDPTVAADSSSEG